MTHASARRAIGLLAIGTLGALAACGDSSDIKGSNGSAPFGGRTIQFNSTYLYFPSDFSMSIVRDTMPQDDACRILNMYAGTKPPLRGLPVLPYTQEHYALVITVDSVMAGDDVTLDPTTSSGAGDMRYAGISQFGATNNQTPLWAARAGGLVRISHLTQYQHADGKFNLQFDTGEAIAEDFTVDACPK